MTISTTCRFSLRCPFVVYNLDTCAGCSTQTARPRAPSWTLSFSPPDALAHSDVGFWLTRQGPKAHACFSLASAALVVQPISQSSARGPSPSSPASSSSLGPRYPHLPSTGSLVPTKIIFFSEVVYSTSNMYCRKFPSIKKRKWKSPTISPLRELSQRFIHFHLVLVFIFRVLRCVWCMTLTSVIFFCICL